MALNEIAGPAFATSGTNAVTTSAFTPASGALLVALVGVGNGTSLSLTNVAITDSSGSGSWTPLVQTSLAGSGGYGGVFIRAAFSGSNTVTATATSASVLGIGIEVRQFAGAAAVAAQTGATAKGDSVGPTLSITPTTAGSQVVGGWGDGASAVVLTANSSTTIYGQYDGASGGSTLACWKATSLSGAGTAIAIGYTNGGVTGHFALAEILPAPVTFLPQAVRAKLPHPPIGTGAFKGRVNSSPGAPVQNPPYHIVQHASSTASFTSGTTNSATVTFGKNITPGNTVVLFIGVNMGTGDISASSVTTNGSADNWQFPQYASFYGNIGISGVALDFNSAGGAAAVVYSITQSVAATTSETTSVLLDAFEVAGLGPNPGVDAFTSGDAGGASTTTWTSGSFPGDPAGANNGIFLGSVCLYVNASNTTSTVTGPGGWTNEPALSGSIQQGGTGTGNKFFVYQLSGYEGPFTSSPPTLVYSGTNSAAADAYGAWGISLYNGISPSWWGGAIQAWLPHPPAGIGSIRGGRVASNKGAPVRNPAPPAIGPVFRQATAPARIRPSLPPRGRAASNHGGPVSNPLPPPPFTALLSSVPGIAWPGAATPGDPGPPQNLTTGPVFYPAVQAIRAKLPQQPLGTGTFRGRTYSSPPQPVRNPTPGPPFRLKPAPVRYVLPPWQPRAGRIGSSFGAPVQNPIHGPPVYAPHGPVRPRIPRPFAGSITAFGQANGAVSAAINGSGFGGGMGSSGAPVRNPSAGPAFQQAVQAVRARLPQLHPRAGRITSSPGAPLRNPGTGPVFRQADAPARARTAPPFSKGRVSSSPGAPVRNPVAGPVFYLAVRPVRAPVPQVFSKGRVGFNAGAPLRNPTAGPVFRQAVAPARIRITLPPRGRVASNPGGPVQNPAPVVTGPPFYPLRFPARIRPSLPPRGRIASNAGAPVVNPAQGSAFRQATTPVRARIPLPPRGRVTASALIPVAVVPPVGPVLHPFRSPVRVHPSPPPRGRVASNAGAPVHNPTPGPVFRQAVKPAHAVIPQISPRGRAYSNPGGPVSNPPPPTPGPPFRPSGVVRARYLNQVYVLGNPGLIYVDSRDGTP